MMLLTILLPTAHGVSADLHMSRFMRRLLSRSFNRPGVATTM